MNVTPIKTRAFLPPKDNLWELIETSIPTLKENTILAITSKIVSIGEGRCVPQERVKSKDELIIAEAEKYLPRELVPEKWVMHTLKNNLFVPTAGIDESNGAGYYILWPKNPTKSAHKIWKFLRERHKIKNCGVIITDSHSVPLRRGVVGISLAHWGFLPLHDYRGKRDIFGKKLVISQTNIPDSLASAAVVAMGEGNEKTPLALITDIPNIKFVSRAREIKKPHSSFNVPIQEDLYKPFLEAMPWKRGKSGKS